MWAPLIITFYVIIGIVYALLTTHEDKKKGKIDVTMGLADPATFWLLILFWPIVALFRALRVKDEKK